MTKFPVGGAAVLIGDKMKGILVEGDIRRTFTKSNQGLETKISEIANYKPITIRPDQLAHEALELMETKEKLIQIIPVVENEKFLGFIRQRVRSAEEAEDILQEANKRGYKVSSFIRSPIDNLITRLYNS